MYQAIHFDHFTKTCLLRDDHEGWQEFQYSATCYKIDPKGKFPTLDGKRANPIPYKGRKDREDPELYETDVDMNLRVLLELYMDSDEGPAYHNRAFIDIEAETKGAINLEYCQAAPGKVTAIALYDENTKEYWVYVLDEQRQLTAQKKKNVNIVPCSDEETLFTYFLNKWEEIDPTIVVGWNSDNYDIPYLYNRMKRIVGDRQASRLSPLGIVRFDEFDSKMPYKIAGVNSMDYMRLYKKFIPKQQPSYGLDAICMDELGKGKIKYKGSLNKLFREDPEKFIEYNVNDVLLIVELDAKKKFLDLAVMLAHMGHVPYHYVYQSSKLIEGAIMTYLKRKGIVSVNKPTTINPDLQKKFEEQESEDDDKFAGAYVKEPIPGLYSWNIDEDLTSLYPSLGILLNVGFETLLFKILTDDPFDDSWNLKEMKEKDQQMVVQVEKPDGRLKSIGLDKLIDFIEKNEVLISPNGVAFDSKKESIISEIMQDWFKKRKEFVRLAEEAGKKGDMKQYEYYDRIQAIMKIFLNSIYGVLGLQSFRYTDGKDYIASAITSGGRLTIMRSADFVNQYIHDECEPQSEEINDYVIMSDTDSLYISIIPVLKKYNINTKDDKVVIELAELYAQRLSVDLNGFYKTFTTERFNSKTLRLEMKSETIGKSLYVSAKKQYAQFIVFSKGVHIPADHKKAFDFKGLDFMKSSFPKLFRDFTQGVVKDILFEKPKSHVDKLILDFREKFKSLPMEDVMKPTGMNKYKEYYGGKPKPGRIFSQILPHCPVNTKAAIYYNDLLKFKGLDKKHSVIQVGDKMKWMYLKKNPYNITVLAISENDPPEEITQYVHQYMDREAMFDRNLVKKLDKIYENLKWGQINFNRNVLKFIKSLNP